MISVVVPIYNVEDYLAPCLDSIARQTFSDLEVLLVNDGATDSSREIAAAYAQRDPRFRLIDRPNGGLSAARNTGIDAATGEYMSFVDSDDVLPDDAFALHMAALEQTGSDFSTGQVLRLTATGTRRTRFLAGVFSQERLKTHITEFPRLLADRTAWNKVWRREFWDAHGFRFPEGRLNEDIPVVLPAHFSARSVDVIPEPVYHWRIRETGGLSITERRLERRALLDRIAAVSDVSHYLAEHAPKAAKHWYDETLVADDLKYYLNVLEYADDEYRELFLDRVNALLDDAADDIYDPLKPIERLKWALVRRRRMPELLRVLRFEREDLADRPPVREHGKWYADYPYRGDPEVGIPDSVYRYEDQFAAVAHVDGLERDGEQLRIDGWTFIDGIGAAAEGDQSVRLSLVRPGRLMRVRLAAAAIRLRTRPVRRVEANAESGARLADVSWSGFTATFDPRRLRTLGRWRPGSWELYATVQAQGVKRRRSRFSFGGAVPPGAVDLPGAPGVLVRAAPTEERGVVVEVLTRWAKLRTHRLDGDSLHLTGEVHPPAAKLALALRGEEGTRSLKVQATASGSEFSVALPLAKLRDAATQEGAWRLVLTGEGGERQVALPEAVAGGEWPAGEQEVALVRDQGGDTTLALRPARPLVTGMRWTADGALEVQGRAPAFDSPHELVLVTRGNLEQYAFRLDPAAGGGPFTSVLTPAAVPSLGGELPLREARWDLCTRPVGRRDEEALVPCAVTAELLQALPLATEVAGKEYVVGADRTGAASVYSGRDIAVEHRGRFRQRRLQETVYASGRSQPLRDAVLYSSFHGRQYSDSPRAIHEELVRRHAPLEHLWLVRDGRCRVPDTARVVREGSPEHHEALARSRYVVFNDHFPDWFARREDQVCVQTWHGTPFKKLGFDVSRLRGTARKFETRWDQQVVNWQYVVSPNRFATPLLREAFALEGELLETGYPRDDVLARPDREAHARALRARLGIPDGVRTVLYAPTFRDHLRDERRRFRMDLQLDLGRLREALGPDTTILFRKHHYIADAVPETADGFVRDVTTYPDATELLLAADVLLTDYSSMMVDFANTGRPMLFFTYDLEAYTNDIRGFYIDFEETVPGPLLRTTDEVADALRDLDAVQAAYAPRYAQFVERFCELDDGGAAGRVVDRVFGVTSPSPEP